MSSSGSSEAPDFPELAEMYEVDPPDVCLFKVLPCNARAPHDHGACPFFHGRRDQRRDPRIPQTAPGSRYRRGYMVRLCPYLGLCDPVWCSFAHSLDELVDATVYDRRPSVKWTAIAAARVSNLRYM